MQKLFSKFFRFFFSKINRILTEFFSNIKKLPKLFNNFFSNFFFEKFFLRKLFSTKFFVQWKFLLSNFFWRKFFFSQKYSCENFFRNIFANFFCIWYLRNNVFCGIVYSKFCLLRFFLFCNFGVRKKIVNFFCDFFRDKREYQIWKCFYSKKK